MPISIYEKVEFFFALKFGENAVYYARQHVHLGPGSLPSSFIDSFFTIIALKNHTSTEDRRGIGKFLDKLKVTIS